MSDRKPPADVVYEALSIYTGVAFQDDAEDIVEHLERHGYVIVHPDDVPAGFAVGQQTDEPRAFDYGWDACRAHIFGADQ